MKTLLAIFALIVSCSAAAQTVTVSITVATADAVRIENALGAAKNLMDNGTPPKPRAATPAEVKQYVADTLTNLVVSYEYAKAQTTADAAIVIAPLPIN